ncbi:MAG: MOSC domain-containing protein, partial [Solirubrobacterales bacterium]
QFGEDRRRYRPNLVIGGVEGMAERGWIGRRLRIGAAVLSAREPCERCIVTTIDPDTLELEPGILTRLREQYNGIMGV